MNNAATLLCAIACGLAAAAGEKTADLDRVVFVLNSQPNSFHHSIAAETKEGIKTALTGADVAPPHHVYSVADHADEIPLHGAWTYFPVIEALAAKFTGRNDLADWFVFLEEGSDVKVDVLAEMLGSHSPDDDVFLGHSLEDDDHVVIHHYDKPGEIKFPLADAGFVLSRAVVDRVKREYERLMEDEASKMPKDFSIDPVYELAKALKHLFDGMDVHPVLVRNDTRLCHEAAEASACAVRPRVRPACAEDQALDDAKTLFAVKTCKQFHKERLTVIKDTWAKAATNVKYFSEEEDADFETVVLPGVANTERGHCGKTLAIIKYFNENAGVEGWEWLVIADDDTMLGVHKMLGHLSCYDSKDFVG
jgi:UDP-glucose:O-linked fucose beta-1,3-glucosyltransferase